MAIEPPTVDLTPGMRRLLASEVASNFGSMLSRLAIPWIAALMLNASALQMAWLVIADVVAGAAGSLLVGGLVDRYSRKRLMILSDVGRAVAIALVAILLYCEALAFWMLVVQSSVNGVLAMMFGIARSAWLADHVPHAALTTRNAQMSAASSTSESVAFASGGWIYQWFGPLLALVGDTVSYLVSAACLRGLTERPSARGLVQDNRQGRGNWLGEAVAGFSAVKVSRVLRSVAVCDVFLALSFSITAASYMIFVSRDLAFDTGVLGLIFATGAVGSLAGAAVASGLGRRFGSNNALLGGLLVAGLGALLVPLAPHTPLVSFGRGGLFAAACLIGHQVIGDAGSVMAMIHSRTLRQIHSPAALRGRVDAALRGMSQLATLVGALLGGWIATAQGSRLALAYAAVLLLLATPCVWITVRGRDRPETQPPPG